MRIVSPICRYLRIAVLAAVLPIPAAAQAATISANDTVILRVMSWDHVDGTVKDWPALSGPFRVRPDGQLDLPLIDPVRAAGRSTGAIEKDLVAALVAQLALSAPPDVTVILDGFRPVVVSGLVRDPGEIEFTPGMTVRHAIALAGGPEEALRRGTDAFREMVDTQGTLRLLALDRMRLQARLVRLRAEREGLEEIATPDGFAGPMAQRLLSEQTEIMERRRERLASEREALGDQIILLETEIAALEQQYASLERQREMAQEARANVAALATDGLVVNNRILESERTLLLIENQLLDSSTAMLRAKLDAAATRRSIDELQYQRETDVVEELIDAEARLAEVEQRIETTAQLVDIDGIRVAELLAFDSQAGAERTAVATYRIFRADGSGIEADLAFVLEPGDLVEMVLPAAGPRRFPLDLN